MSTETAYLKAAKGSAQPSGPGGMTVPKVVAWLVWPAILTLPLALTRHDNFRQVFKREWYDPELFPEWPSPLGLSLGILAVIVGQFFMLTYHWMHVHGVFGPLTPVQKEGASKHHFWKAAVEHLFQPEGFVMLGLYLSGTWMFNLMPSTYYSFEGGIDGLAVAMQLLLQDLIQYLMHLGEHKIHAWIYQKSHKPHHRFTNPKLFDAFNGSPADTFFMILVPLFITAQTIHTNTWSYMAFGTLYANWLCLIHSEVVHPWDWLFRRVGFGTAADHHVHHKLFSKNFGHTFMYSDMLFGTYLNPARVQLFNKLD